MSARFEPLPTIYPPRLIVVKRDNQCGIGSWTPRWLQKFADPKWYLVVFSCLGVLQGACFTYFVGVLSTLEKRFAFESKVAGVILIADNVTPVVACLLVGYYGMRVHKPQFVSWCMLLVVLGCFLSVLPYWMYGPGLHILEKSFAHDTGREFCERDLQKSGSCVHSGKGSHPAVFMLFLASVLNGFGSMAFYIVGTPYLDDNIRKKNSPMYFSAMGALRIFGPTLGFLLSSFCLKFYEDPFYDPGIDPHNPRWVGAWWMGFFILGISIFVFTCLLALFPRELPARFRSEKKDGKEKESELPKLKDFPQAIKRLMKNPILVCHVISITFQVNGFAGYFVFMPKFMESQYQTSASEASLFSGATGIASMLLGILLGGFLIQRFKPRPRYLTGYMVLVEVFSVIGLFVSIFLGCDPLSMPGTSIMKGEETLNLYNECNADCGCTKAVFEPVCGADGISTFFSPCFAGCPNTTSIASSVVAASASHNKTVFEDCACASVVNNTITFTSSTVTSGFCTSTCNMFLAYIIVLCVGKFISSTARVGNTLITFRCVDAKDKAFALGVFGSVLALFAFIPYPLIYGALTDSACLVWEEKCGRTGNCWLYDADKFRLYLHGMSIALIGVGIFFDFVVFLLSGRLRDFYGEDEETQEARRVARWIKEEEEEDVIFTKCPRREVSEMDAVM